ncbi:TetR/AcrR family transcriptional regulator [Actinomadura latina]|uniref:Helix-turn-helix transcriptional regulator n=1 Tax=Actinomadura latina TaxID=163603 RepID=A0A846ZE74_9ACTN|nr:helix-turn-helix domain-containing protein [Actinomadura latina]NKZ08875.1 helix-turn-helix transcriptional regulator [Actinomadura latina]
MSRGTVAGDEVRAGILRAAAAVLAERGESASMSDIAAAAGVGRDALDSRFPTRDALLHALYEAAVADLTASLDGARLDGVPIEEAGDAVTTVFLSGALRQPPGR